MKVAFIEKDNLRTDKLGIMQLSSILKRNGHETKLFIGLCDFDPNQFDATCFSVMTGDHDWYFSANDTIKSKNNKIKSIFGGPHITFFPESAAHNTNIDYVVIGPGENVIVDVVEGEVSGKVIRGRISDIQELPPLDRDIQYEYDQFGGYPMKRFIACRDCPNQCSYCFNHCYHQIMKHDKDRFYQSRLPEQIITEILDVKENYGLKLAYFNDDDLVRDEKWITEFCDRIIKTRIKFCGSARADSLIKRNMYHRLHQSGCTFLNIALESAVRETQVLLRRQSLTNEMIREACEDCYVAGIKVRLQNMIGLPVDNPLEDALQTLEFNQSLHITDSWAAIFQPFPSTDLWKYCKEKDLIESGCKPFYEETPLKFDCKDEINNLHKWWHIAVRENMPIPIVRKLIKIPIVPEQAKVMQDIRWKEGAKLLYEDL